jgi:AraC-like DNA-binding protein
MQGRQAGVQGSSWRIGRASGDGTRERRSTLGAVVTKTASKPAPPRGVLFPQRLDAQLALDHYPPSPALAPYIVRYWVARWQLPPGESRQQLVIPHPCANLEIEDGRARVRGVTSRTTTVVARGTGRIVGIKLVPGAIRAFWPRSAAELTDHAVAVSRVFSAPQHDWVAAAALAPEPMVARFEALLAGDVPAAPDVRLRECRRIHDDIATHRELLHVDELAARYHRSVRSLQLMFRDFVGVSPKWVIMRYRMHEAAERLDADPELPLARLARELGYFDQAHFSRNFSQVVGLSPARYAQAARAKP